MFFFGPKRTDVALELQALSMSSMMICTITHGFSVLTDLTLISTHGLWP